MKTTTDDEADYDDEKLSTSSTAESDYDETLLTTEASKPHHKTATSIPKSSSTPSTTEEATETHSSRLHKTTQVQDDEDYDEESDKKPSKSRIATILALSTVTAIFWVCFLIYWRKKFCRRSSAIDRKVLVRHDANYTTLISDDA